MKLFCVKKKKKKMSCKVLQNTQKCLKGTLVVTIVEVMCDEYLYMWTCIYGSISVSEKNNKKQIYIARSGE